MLPSHYPLLVLLLPLGLGAVGLLDSVIDAVEVGRLLSAAEDPGDPAGKPAEWFTRVFVAVEGLGLCITVGALLGIGFDLSKRLLLGAWYIHQARNSLASEARSPFGTSHDAIFSLFATWTTILT